MKNAFTLYMQAASNSMEDKSGELLLYELCDDLVALAKAENHEAFDRLVALHQERVYALAYRILENADDAADVQQETFIRAWQSIRRFRQDAAFSTWLHKITVNLCISKKRRKQLDCVNIDDETIGSIPAPSQEEPEAVAALKKVLASMPVHYRVLIVLRDLEERPFEEIAQVLGCSVESARVRVCKARKLLRDKMRPYLAEEDI